MDNQELKKLQVAHPRETQLATFPVTDATGGATRVQPTSVKALAEKVLWRNHARNNSATTDRKQRNLGATVDEQRCTDLENTLADTCRGLDITTADLRKALSLEDLADIEAGDIGSDTLTGFGHLLIQRRDVERGRRPPHWDKAATCSHCGIIWLWFSGEVTGCPWCRNRVIGKPIPRPDESEPPEPDYNATCGACRHFQRIDHPNLGHCTQGEPEAPVGLWDTDRRWCRKYQEEA